MIEIPIVLKYSGITQRYWAAGVSATVAGGRPMIVKSERVLAPLSGITDATLTDSTAGVLRTSATNRSRKPRTASRFAYRPAGSDIRTSRRLRVLTPGS